MKEFIEYLLKQIVTHPEEISVEESKEEEMFLYTIRCNKEDVGIIIGKEGRNIKSLRNIAKSKAIKDNIRIKVVIDESLQNPKEPQNQDAEI